MGCGPHVDPGGLERPLTSVGREPEGLMRFRKRPLSGWVWKKKRDGSTGRVMSPWGCPYAVGSSLVRVT